ncbi:MAG: AgrD family cyclic lactone autoinducer peptide [Ruminococcus sp.]
MNKIQKNMLGKVAAIGKAAAIKAAGATSWAGCHQPKEPKALKNIKK